MVQEQGVEVVGWEHAGGGVGVGEVVEEVGADGTRPELTGRGGACRVWI